MTTNRNAGPQEASRGLASTSGSLDLELLGLRVNGAQLGAMLGVTRQSVSRAVHRGTISPAGPDGCFDAKRATREWLENSNPSKVRARLLKSGSESLAELRQQVATLSAEVERLRDEIEIEREYGDAREKAAGFRAVDTADENLCQLLAALAGRLDEAVAAHRAGDWTRWIDELIAVEFYGQDLDEYRSDCFEDEAADASRDPDANDAALASPTCNEE